MPDDEREFLTLEELKPQQLTELGILNQSSVASDFRLSHSSPDDSNTAENQENAIFRVQPNYCHQTLHPLQQPQSHHTLHQQHQLETNQQIYYDLNSQKNTE